MDPEEPLSADQVMSRLKDFFWADLVSMIMESHSVLVKFEVEIIGFGLGEEQFWVNHEVTMNMISDEFYNKGYTGAVLILTLAKSHC